MPATPGAFPSRGTEESVAVTTATKNAVEEAPSQQLQQLQLQQQQQQQQDREQVHIPVAEVVVMERGNNNADAEESASAASTSGPCPYPVGSIVRLQGLSKISMNGRLGTIQAITPGTQKAIIKIKGQSSPVVVSARHMIEAFPPDTVVWTPGETPQVAIVLGTANKKVTVFITETEEKAEYEPEQLTILEELE